MKSFISLYEDLLKSAVADKKSGKPDLVVIDCDKHHLDCLLSPKAYPAVIRLGNCSCSDEENEACSNKCFFNAITKDKDGNIVISDENCVGCGECITNCRPGNLSDIKETLPIFEDINNGELVYAMIAPAYISQFSNDVSPGKLRSAFKMLGFAGMIEVALFADILTLKEALEFDRMIESEDDYMLTSCCCPMWIAMIKKVYDTLVPHLPPSVSPMVACGRAIKTLHPEVKTVFIGPCIAKKAEAREKDVAGAVDYVLTFEETKGIFEAAELFPAELKEDLRDHSSSAGRIYARTAGVSEAVKNTLQRLKPDRDIPLKAKHADGVPDCKTMLKELLDGKAQANFIEGMGCKGGCIGGPKALISKDDALGFVNEYAQSAQYKTPADNPFVLELLEKLGFDTIESLLEGENIFTRDFGKQFY